MDLCVLIPNEFSLLNSSLDEKDDNVFNKPTFLVTSNCKIEKGKKFKVFDGDFRLGKIKQGEILSFIPEDLESYLDFDFIIENRRHCNWIKFLAVAKQFNNQINLICSIDENEFIFETTKKIEANCQINVYYDLSNLNSFDKKSIDKPVLENEILKKKLIKINFDSNLFIKAENKKTNYEDLVGSYENIFKRKKNDSMDKSNEIDSFKRIKCKNFLDSELIKDIKNDDKLKNVKLEKEKNFDYENVDKSLNDAKFCLPINLVKKPKTSDNLNFNEEVTKAINNIKNDRDSLMDQSDKNLVEFNQFTATENCVNENEITLKENSSTSTNLSAINNSKRPHPFSYHRNKTCNTRSNMLPCEVCGKAFDRPSLLRRHMRTHTGEKPHVCDVCGKGFSTSSSLNTHRRIHSGEKPHGCPTCGKKFTASSNLYYHRMTHTKNKPHKCTLCEKSFPTPGDLKSHAYTHNGNWPHKCQLCGKGFAKQNCLKTHLFLHTGNKPHVCNVCNKSFALESNLRAHYKTHQNNSFDNSKGVDLVYRNKAGSTDANSESSNKSFIKQNINNTSPIAVLYSNALSSINKNSNKSLIDTLSNLNSFKNLLSCNNLENNKTCENSSLSLTDSFADKESILKTNYNNLISNIFSQSVNTVQSSSSMNNSLNLLNQLPLTPTDSPINSSTNLALPWLFNKQTEENLNQQLKNNFGTKDNLFQNLTGNLLLSNNLFPQICQNNTQNLNDNLQQQLILMATTAQLLSLKHK